VHSVTGEEARTLVDFSCGPGLAFPYLDPRTGEPFLLEDGVTPYVRVKIDKPWVNPTAGKAMKYAQRKGAGNRMYFPAGTWASWLEDTQVVVFVTEGEKKAVAGLEAGLFTVGLGGVDNWSSGKVISLDGVKRSDPIQDLDKIAWKGRAAVLAYDHDQKPDTVRNVTRAAIAFAVPSAAPGGRLPRWSITSSRLAANTYSGYFQYLDPLCVSYALPLIVAPPSPSRAYGAYRLWRRALS
jgi:hypothetical protein